MHKLIHSFIPETHNFIKLVHIIRLHGSLIKAKI